MAALPMLPVLVGLTAVSTAVTVMGTMKQAKAQSRAATFNQAVARQDSAIAEQQSVQAAGQVARENRMRMGSIKAAIGGSGISFDGSALDVIGDVVAQGELERQNVLYEGELRKRGYRIEGELSGMEARAARSAGKYRAGAALLSGAATAYQLGDEAGMFKGLNREGT